MVYRLHTAEACSTLPQPELQKPTHTGSGGIYLLANRIPQTEGRTVLYTVKKQQLGLLGTYGVLRSVIRSCQRRNGAFSVRLPTTLNKLPIEIVYAPTPYTTSFTQLGLSILLTVMLLLLTF